MCRASVIVPLYNAESYVAETITSILAQDFRDFELIIVDDGSTDGSVAVCRTFSDPRIRIIRQPNRGVSAARNTGIEHARGEYIGFIDSDDIWVAHKLGRHVALLDARPEVGVSFSTSRYINAAGEPLYCSRYHKCRNITAADILIRNPVGNGSTAVLRRQAIDDSAVTVATPEGPKSYYFDPELRLAEDNEFWMRIATTNWKFEGIDEPLTHYRIHEGTVSVNLDQMKASWEHMMSKVQSYAPEVIARWGRLASANNLQYIARRAIHNRDARAARTYVVDALGRYPGIVAQTPFGTLMTLGAAGLISVLPEQWFAFLAHRTMTCVFMLQQYRAGADRLT